MRGVNETTTVRYSREREKATVGYVHIIYAFFITRRGILHFPFRAESAKMLF
jgi:hypothetical protein